MVLGMYSTSPFFSSDDPSICFAIDQPVSPSLSLSLPPFLLLLFFSSSSIGFSDWEEMERRWRGKEGKNKESSPNTLVGTQ